MAPCYWIDWDLGDKDKERKKERASRNEAERVTQAALAQIHASS
jgi:hypothetical protein